MASTTNNTLEESSALHRRHEQQHPQSYQQLSTVDVEKLPSDEDDTLQTPNHLAARRTLWNFVLMSILFSANHGSVVSCLGLATVRLGSTGAIQSGILFFCYTASALLGSTYVTKKAGSRQALLYGMGLYCVYVGCFWLATLATTEPMVKAFAWGGAAVGGVGAGFLRTAQGAYYASCAEEHARQLDQSVELSTASLAGIFAFLYLR